MAGTKSTQGSKKANKKTPREYIWDYLQYVGNDYPSYEDFQLWAFEKNIMPLEDTKQGEYKGVIYIYSKRYLTRKITAGVRGSGNMAMMLRELEEQQVRQEKQGTSEAPVQLVMDFQEVKKGKHERQKIKSK